MEQILIDNGFKHFRTFGNKKEYERTIGKHKMRVRPAAKTVLVTYEYYMGNKKDITTKRVKEDEAIEIIKGFKVLELLL
jgi:hypothetical protein